MVNTLFKKKKEQTIAIILARGGSKGIKNKNIIKINGRPLIYWSIKSCLKSKKIQSVWVSSDSRKILSLSKKYGANTVTRPKTISGSLSTSESAWIHALKYINSKIRDIDAVVGIQPTSPIRPSKLIDHAINKFYKKKFDSLFTSQKTNHHPFLWTKRGDKFIANYSLNKRPMRQQIKNKYFENGSFYIFNASKFLKKKCRLFGKIGTYEMSKIYSFQIDGKEDLKIINSLLKDLKHI